AVRSVDETACPTIVAGWAEVLNVSVNGPGVSRDVPTWIRYVVPTTASKVTDSVVPSTSSPSSASPSKLEPVNTASEPWNVPLKVTVAGPGTPGAQLYQTVLSTFSSPFGSPPSRVAPAVVPLVEPELPERPFGAVNVSFPGVTAQRSVNGPPG